MRRKLDDATLACYPMVMSDAVYRSMSRKVVKTKLIDVRDRSITTVSKSLRRVTWVDSSDSNPQRRVESVDPKRHNGYPLSMNGAHIRVLKETHQISLRRLLNGSYRRALERAMVSRRKWWGFLMPPVVGADFLVALVASCFLVALHLVDCLAVYFV
ncbi:UNVERIFIED_CONTAM: hypothetical protein Scaly_2215600 [Sesamum calycinum]|uniref:Uncharacterized protein n=1 Tax=Sesamum calycinum TaxID=2727403 RepID=A0AAW2MRG9_9LAMI